ncbi:MAG: bifunctional serine/threonine-protein kinase/formylglycine-generating enzyme family protein, partial [Planctomycetota bacterium]
VRVPAPPKAKGPKKRPVRSDETFFGDSPNPFGDESSAVPKPKRREVSAFEELGFRSSGAEATVPAANPPRVKAPRPARPGRVGPPRASRPASPREVTLDVGRDDFLAKGPRAAAAARAGAPESPKRSEPPQPQPQAERAPHRRKKKDRPAPVPGPGGGLTESLIGQTVGGCRIEKFLGQGGMGAVFLGTQLDLQRHVAFKVLAEHLTQDPKQVEQFFREARALARLEHPNIVTIYSVGKDEGVHFLLMQLVTGGSLKDWVKRNGKPSLEQACDFVRQIAKGLGEAHSKGIIHRDIKPDNVLVADGPTLKITDFGLARMDEDAGGLGFATGKIVGTPHFMSPEQIDGRKVDLRTDIYALGATFYKLLTGQYPFRGDSAVEVLLMHVNDALMPPSEVVPEIPEPISRLCCRMMAKDPDERFATIEDLERGFEAALSGQQVEGQALTDRPAVGPTVSVFTDGAGNAVAMGQLFRPTEVGRPKSFYVLAATLLLGFVLVGAVAFGPLHDKLFSSAAAVEPGSEPSPLDAVSARRREGIERLLAEKNFAAAQQEYLDIATLYPAAADVAGGKAQFMSELAVAEADRRVEAAEALRAARQHHAAFEALLSFPDGARELGADEKIDFALEELAADLLMARQLAYLPLGRFEAGEEGSLMNPKREEHAGGIYVDAYEVTNASFADFLAACPDQPAPAGWSGRTPPAGTDQLPVTGVTVGQAVAYAKNKGGRLLTPAEWEKAARGADGAKWPWGNGRDGLACNWRGAERGGPTRPGTFERDRSSIGAFDLAGNVAELTAGPRPGTGGATAADRVVLASGGGFKSAQLENTRGAFFVEIDDTTSDSGLGFRCAYPVK